MKSRSLLSFAFLGLALLAATNVFAQLDSLYTQQWNRDPIDNLNVTTSAQRQIITAEQIRVSGYTHLSQVLHLIDGWTIENLEHNPNHPIVQSNGTGSYNHQNWVLMLNGQRIEMNRDVALDVNQLGVSVVDVERIEIINTNGMYLGEFTQNGLINIITKKNKQNGFGYRGFYANYIDRNEHFLYSSNTSHTLSYTKGNFTISNSFGYLSDPNNLTINRRDRTLDGEATPRQYSNRIETQYTGAKFSHQLTLSYTKKEVYPTSYFFQSGYLGLYHINPKNQIRLSSSYVYNRSTLNDANLLTNTLQHRFLKSYKSGNLIWQTGLGADYYKYKHTSTYYDNRFPNTDTSVVIIKPYTSINIPITKKINLFADAQVAFAHGKIAPRISAGIYKRVSIISNYSFVVGYTETLLEESFLTTINQAINAIEGAPYFYNPKLATADFYYNLNFGSSVKFSFNSGLKNAYDLPDYRYYLVPTGPLSTIDYHVDKSIKRATYQLNWVNRINFHYDIVKNLVFDINYMNTRMVNTWDENLRNIPKHKFTFVLQYDLPKRFTLWSRNYIQSKTQWFNAPGYYNMYKGTELYYTLPPRLGWEMGMSKKLFKEYIHLNITARNLFAKGVNYNPDQLHYNGRLFVSIIFNINGIGGSKTPKP